MVHRLARRAKRLLQNVEAPTEALEAEQRALNAEIARYEAAAGHILELRERGVKFRHFDARAWCIVYDDGRTEPVPGAPGGS